MEPLSHGGYNTVRNGTKSYICVLPPPPGVYITAPGAICLARHASHSTSSGAPESRHGGGGGGGGTGGGGGGGQGFRRGRRSYVQLPCQCARQLGCESCIVTRLQSALIVPHFTACSKRVPKPGQCGSPKLRVRFEPTTVPLARFHPSSPVKHCRAPPATDQL